MAHGPEKGPGDQSLDALREQVSQKESGETKQERIATLKQEIAELEAQVETATMYDRFMALDEASKQAEVDRVRENRWGKDSKEVYTIEDRAAELKHHAAGPGMKQLRLTVKQQKLEKLLAE